MTRSLVAGLAFAVVALGSSAFAAAPQEASSRSCCGPKPVVAKTQVAKTPVAKASVVKGRKAAAKKVLAVKSTKAVKKTAGRDLSCCESGGSCCPNGPCCAKKI